jgi:hypothetical protein
MAGDWFPLQLWKSKAVEVISIAAVTRRSRHEVLGLLCDLWSWASSESVDGHIRGVRLLHLTDAVGGDATFWQAVEAVNWLAEDEQGIVIPGWEHWLSRSAKTRMKAARRADRYRKRNGQIGNASVTPKRDANVTTEQIQNSTEQKSNKSSSSSRRKKKSGEKAERPKNPLFDALAEVTGSDPVVSGSHIGKLSALLARAEPPYTPEDVREFGRRFLALCSYAAMRPAADQRPTLGEIEKNIGKLRSQPVVTQSYLPFFKPED